MMAEPWRSAVETWLLECSEAYTGSHLESSATPVPDETLNDEQTEQLLVACALHNEQLLHAIFTLLEERNRHCELLERVLRQMFVLSRSQEAKLRYFTLQFAPTLIYLDLLCLALGDAKVVRSVELVLLALYNCELLNSKGQHRLPHYRLPTLARMSCYHDPASLGPASFSTDSLVRLETSEHLIPPLPPPPIMGPAPHTQQAITDGPPASVASLQLASISASTRSCVVSGVVAALNAVITQLHAVALANTCRAASRLVTHGLVRGGPQQRSSYSDSGAPAPLPTPRLCVTADLLLQLVLAAHYAVHNLGDRDTDNNTAKKNNNRSLSRHHHHRHHSRNRSSLGSECVCVAIQAIEDIQMRSEYELLPELLHLCYAVTHNLKRDNIVINGDPSDSPPLVVPPPPPLTPLSKTCITNASFRTKKLPEDIPVQSSEQAAEEAAAKVLVSITEDLAGEEAVPAGGGGGMLAGILRRDGRDSGRSHGGTVSSAIKFTPTKFSPANIPIPGLKRRGDKLKNGGEGNAAAGGGKKDKQRNTNGTSDCADAVDCASPGRPRKEQEQLQQLIELSVISRPTSAGSSAHEPLLQGCPPSSPRPPYDSSSSPSSGSLSPTSGTPRPPASPPHVSLEYLKLDSMDSGAGLQ